MDPRPRKLRASDLALFLDYDGVLHPDAVYRTKHGLELRARGEMMMHAHILTDLLQDFPDIRIVLSTSWVRLLGYSRARAALPAKLQARVISATWHSRMTRSPIEGYDSWSRHEQIRAAVTRAGITHWLAIDDDTDHTWPAHDHRLIRCESNMGLGSEATQMELRDKLQALIDTAAG
nr:HAD domain-containing protein [Pseudomonas sp. B35(2017)]